MGLRKMKLIKVFSAIFVVMGISMGSARAVVVEDLFSIEMAIADQTTSLRLDAFKQAFQQIIIKVSGSDDALSSPGFKNPIERSARYVKQFSYFNRSLPDDEEAEAEVLFIRVNFDQQLIEGLLIEHNFPVWGRERPSSLLVISYDVNENIKLVSDDTAPDMIELLDQAAASHAVPVLFPLMDLEDMSMVGISDVVSRQFDKIESMALRYGPDAVVVGQIIGRSGEGWQGDWEVRFDDQIFKWNYKSSSKKAVVDQVIEHLARILALEYALDSQRNSEQSLLISISGMEGIEKLISVESYLKSLNVVDSVRVALIIKDVVTYRLSLRNDAADLQRLIELGDVLELEDFPQVNSEGEEQIILNYSFIERGVAN